MSEEIKELLFLLHNDRLTEAGKRKLEQEIERLSKKLEDLEKLNNTNYQSFIEVNNIINKLEKEFDKELENLVYREKKLYTQGIHDTIINHKHLLQELKGSDKE